MAQKGLSRPPSTPTNSTDHAQPLIGSRHGRIAARSKDTGRGTRRMTASDSGTPPVGSTVTTTRGSGIVVSASADKVTVVFQGGILRSFVPTATTRWEVTDDGKSGSIQGEVARMVVRLLTPGVSLCTKCGRPLEDAVSRAIGRGPTCRDQPKARARQLAFLRGQTETANFDRYIDQLLDEEYAARAIRFVTPGVRHRTR